MNQTYMNQTYMNKSNFNSTQYGEEAEDHVDEEAILMEELSNKIQLQGKMKLKFQQVFENLRVLTYKSKDTIFYFRLG